MKLINPLHFSRTTIVTPKYFIAFSGAFSVHTTNSHSSRHHLFTTPFIYDETNAMCGSDAFLYHFHTSHLTGRRCSRFAIHTPHTLVAGLRCFAQHKRVAYDIRHISKNREREHLFSSASSLRCFDNYRDNIVGVDRIN